MARVLVSRLTLLAAIVAKGSVGKRHILAYFQGLWWIRALQRICLAAATATEFYCRRWQDRFLLLRVLSFCFIFEWSRRFAYPIVSFLDLWRLNSGKILRRLCLDWFENRLCWVLYLSRCCSIAHRIRVWYNLFGGNRALHHCFVKIGALHMLILLLMKIVFCSGYVCGTWVYSTLSSLLLTLRHECCSFCLVLLVLLYGLFWIVDARLISSLQEILLTSLWLMIEILRGGGVLAMCNGL